MHSRCIRHVSFANSVTRILLVRHRGHIAPPRQPVPSPPPCPPRLSDLVAQLSVLVLVSLDDGSIHKLLQLHIVQIRADLGSERK